jgi:hypothetical protein
VLAEVSIGALFGGRAAGILLAVGSRSASC